MPGWFELLVEFDQEVDGRFIAEIPALPGVMAYGATKLEAFRRVEKLALATLMRQDRAEDG